MERQVKSKQRVAEHGEVFTARREVDAMLDLVNNETERIESRFLEPACGDGNFLSAILERKLAVVKKKYSGVRYRPDYEMWSVIAVMSIYGVELLPDNTVACRDRLFDIWNKAYTENCKKDATDLCRDVVRFILEKNILCGDALTLRDADGKPIVFAEWGVDINGMVKRTDYTLAELLEPEQIEPDKVPLKKAKKKPASEQLTLFDTGTDTEDKAEGNKVAQYQRIYYLRLREQQEGQ